MKETGYIQGRAFDLEVVDYAGVKMSDRTAWYFYWMYSAAAAEGIRLKVNSGFRDNATQTRFFNMSPADRVKNGIGSLVAKPGFSNHQSGLALDIDTKGDPRVLPWLRANASRFFFYETVPTEPWHWELRTPTAAT